MGGSQDWDADQKGAGVELPAVALVVGGDGDPQMQVKDMGRASIYPCIRRPAAGMRGFDGWGGRGLD